MSERTKNLEPLAVSAVDRGRDDLLSFEDAQPENFWECDEHFQRVLARWAGEKTLTEWRPQLESFGLDCAGPIDQLVRTNNLAHNLPVLQRFDGYGTRREEIEFHPAYHEAGRLIYGSGVMSVLGEWGNTLRSLALFYLSSHNGEAGHNCPLACTAGVIKALLAKGDPKVRDLALRRLLVTDYELLAHGAQFLTEVQGGGDVGANALVAKPETDNPGVWRLYGEKWFCSNATADFMHVTARPEGAPQGTKGLGLFLVPRRLSDGSLNDFAVRRLKDKLGTRSMATGEIDFQGTLAWQVGPIEEGFHTVMTYVINTSRIFNAVACAGAARRALLVGHSYAKHRAAFGHAIAKYPMVQETLADMRAESAALVSASMYAAHLVDEWETGKLGEAEQGFLRTAINLNKLRTALSSHEVVLSALELLGGNGTIETFSVLPRLMRDNIVLENWEGSHNVLLMQVYRDCKRKGFEKGFFAHATKLAAGDATLVAHAKRLEKRFSEVLSMDEGLASLHLRELGSDMAWLSWACIMKADGTDADVLAHFVERRLAQAGVQRDAAYLARIGRLASGV